MGDRKDCARAVQLDRQLSPNAMVFLLSICECKLLDLFRKHEDVLVLLFILTWVYALTASLACPEQPGFREMTSKTLAAVTRNLAP